MQDFVNVHVLNPGELGEQPIANGSNDLSAKGVSHLISDYRAIESLISQNIDKQQALVQGVDLGIPAGQQNDDEMQVLAKTNIIRKFIPGVPAGQMSAIVAALDERVVEEITDLEEQANILRFHLSELETKIQALRPQGLRESIKKADFFCDLLCARNDPEIAGYAFALRTCLSEFEARSAAAKIQDS